ncbi:MAG: HD domain-containing protein [Candidatus Aenigmarchaeota archaeon]|nr:HD domain-containing protein [Candidatus Aenigmarchaeota archaeon]
MDERKLLALLFEAGVLTRTLRSGPYQVGVTTQETVAAHGYRQTLLAYFLAQAEDADVGTVLTMCLAHDLPEARTGDLTFIHKKYVSLRQGEQAILREQLRNLDGAKDLEAAFRAYQKQASLEAHVVRDADLLEALVEAAEQSRLGATVMKRWFLDKRKELHTPTAKRLFDRLQKDDVLWWRE